MPNLPFKFSGYAVWLSVSDPTSVREVMDSLETSLSLSRIAEPHVTFLYGAPFGSDVAASEAFRTVVSSVRNAIALGEEDAKLKPKGVVADSCFGRMDMNWAEITLKASNNLTALQSEASEIFSPEPLPAAVLTDDENESDEDSKKKKKAPNAWRPHLSLAYDDVSTASLTLERVLVEAGKRPGLLGERRITGMSLWDMEGLTVDEWRKVDEVKFE